MVSDQSTVCRVDVRDGASVTPPAYELHDCNARTCITCHVQLEHNNEQSSMTSSESHRGVQFAVRRNWGSASTVVRRQQFCSAIASNPILHTLVQGAGMPRRQQRLVVRDFAGAAMSQHTASTTECEQLHPIHITGILTGRNESACPWKCTQCVSTSPPAPQKCV
jgi:hypothetical protein